MMPDQIVAQAAAALDALHARRPRVHCLMNTVVQKFVADGLSAVGALPSMTSSIDEVSYFVDGADALLINLGTLDAARRQAINTAIETANARGLRWCLDPVHCDASSPRLAFAKSLIKASPAVVRGNAQEMQLLQPKPSIAFVRTGERDLVIFDGQSFEIANGHAWLALATGTGCLTGALISALLSVEPDPVIAAASALLSVGVAAEIAAAESRGPGSFAAALIDALHSLQPEVLIERARITNAAG